MQQAKKSNESISPTRQTEKQNTEGEQSRKLELAMANIINNAEFYMSIVGGVSFFYTPLVEISKEKV